MHPGEASAASVTPRGRRRWIYVALLLVGFGLVWANWRVPVVRFGWQPGNLAAFVLALGTLPTAAIMALGLHPRWMARLVALVMALVSVPAVFLGFGATILFFDTLQKGADPTFMLVRTVAAGPYELRVYRRDGGATTNYGAHVRQERTLLPGVRLVRGIYGRSPADDVRIERLGEDVYSFDGRRTVGPLRRWVWW